MKKHRFARAALSAVVLAATLSGLLVASAQDRDPVAQDDRRPHEFGAKGAPRSGSSLLLDHGGPVTPNPKVYTVFWGNFSSNDLKPALNQFFQGFGNTGYANILTQYMREPAGSNVIPDPIYTGSYDDTSSPPTRGPSVSTIVGEACKAAGASVDPAGVYVVVTSNFPSRVNYCGWHSYGSCTNGTLIPVVYLPNATGVLGCMASSAPGNSYSNGAQSTANIAAHELSEVITDEFENAWYDSGGQEIGDKCAWQFGAPVLLSNSTSVYWTLQEEWSNKQLGCVQVQ